MARTRQLRPEFWDEDETASLPPLARLVLLAATSWADDEGLLDWDADLFKDLSFAHDPSTSVEDLHAAMSALVDAGAVFPFRQAAPYPYLTALLVAFTFEQVIHRPAKSTLRPPSLQNPQVRAMYLRRAGGLCSICRQPIKPDSSLLHEALSMEHKVPRSRGGGDYPSNIDVAHQGCNASKRDATVEEHVGKGPATPPRGRLHDMHGAPREDVREPSVHVHEPSPTERKGREGKGTEVEAGSGSRNVEVDSVPRVASLRGGRSPHGATRTRPQPTTSNETAPAQPAFTGSAVPTSASTATAPAAEVEASLAATPPGSPTNDAVDSNDTFQVELFNMEPTTTKAVKTVKVTKKSKTTPVDPEVAARRETTRLILNEWWDTFGASWMQPYPLVMKQIEFALAKGTARDDLKAALTSLGREARPISGGTLMYALSRKSRSEDVVIAEQTARRDPSNYSTTW